MMGYIDERKQYNYSDVLIRPKPTTLTSRSEPDLIRKYTTKHSNTIFESSPIMVSNMDTTGTLDMYNAVNKHDIIVCFHKYYYYSTGWLAPVLAAGMPFISMGMGDYELERIRYFFDQLNDSSVGICIDVANGYMSKFVHFCKKVRDIYPHIVIMAGNIATSDMIEDYDAAGVDIVKVGVGAGGQCRTREVAGVGIPQLSAVLDCAREADRRGLLICADGGINEYADFAKALGAGADFVMAGSMFAGHDESGGDLIELDGRKYKEVYGMSSETAMKKYHGGVAKHRTSEGRTSLIPYKGPVENTIQSIFGGIRSAMTYTNSATLEEFANNVTFIPVTDTINRKHEKDTTGH